MILSFSRNFAFVAVPRTGTHAVRERLRPLLASNDWEQCGRYERRVFPVPALAAVGHGHLTCGEVQPFLPEDVWRGLFRFGFVRDPLDRFLSCYFFLTRGAPASDPLAGMKRMLDNHAAHLLLRPQHLLLCDAEGEPMVDMIGRYERLEADFAAICEHIGIASAPPETVNASPRPARPPVDSEIEAQVAELYARDYRLFGYAKPGT